MFELNGKAYFCILLCDTWQIKGIFSFHEEL